jgi:DNA-directed RNA polymerase subunit RPC12/RpoP
MFLVTLLAAAIAVILMQFLRLAGGNENGILIIGAAICVLGVVLAYPLFLVTSALGGYLYDLVGTRCPSCGKRKLEWRSGRSEYQYFACVNCGARFRQLWGGDLEDASSHEYDERYKDKMDSDFAS